MSRLKKKLSGERITDRDPVDDIMDKYLRPDYDRPSFSRIKTDGKKLIRNVPDRLKSLISSTWKEMKNMSVKYLPCPLFYCF